MYLWFIEKMCAIAVVGVWYRVLCKVLCWELPVNLIGGGGYNKKGFEDYYLYLRQGGIYFGQNNSGEGVMVY